MANHPKHSFDDLEPELGLNCIEKRWYQKKPGALSLLKPLEFFFRKGVIKRRHQLKSNEFLPSVPTIVVGNITVGGTGKTPIVIALVKYLQQCGFVPGVVSRGYGRRSEDLQIVDSRSSADEVGDEPLLIYQEVRCPIAVFSNRVQASKTLIDLGGVDLIIADDGLQHYALGRHIEIAVVDGKRLFGNGHCLPVGPLREPVERLSEVTCVVVTNREQRKPLKPPLSLLQKPIFSAEIKPVSWRNVCSNESRPVDFFRKKTVHALAGIGQPQKFFNTLKKLGIHFIPHVFPDHYKYQKKDFDFLMTSDIDQVCLMTSKDAVKCQKFDLENSWYLDISLELSQKFYAALDSWLDIIEA